MTGSSFAAAGAKQRRQDNSVTESNEVEKIDRREQLIPDT
jgi:hypothetical protein